MSEGIHELSKRAKDAVKKEGVAHVVFSVDDRPYYEEFSTTQDAQWEAFVTRCAGKHVGAYHS